ncbi:hypothetical protein [Streptomyces sp. NPDC056987]|uniref:hypothetical protein n=1 Tax=Streptomyces sp. NPDC056987 TaxID=3345988 RepID=UPI003637C855
MAQSRLMTGREHVAGLTRLSNPAGDRTAGVAAARERTRTHFHSSPTSCCRKPHGNGTTSDTTW